MSISLRAAVASLGLLILTAGAGPARAVPALQLDIVGGVYDPTTETVIAQGNRFTVLALATATGNTSASDILSDTYFLSAAILPPVAEDPGLNLGTFTLNGLTVSATEADMIYGTPPSDVTGNKDLPSHGIFETYYFETAFQFSGAATTATYNAQDNAGGSLFDEAGSGSFFVAFEIDIAGLAPGGVLHFDLYNTKVKKNGAIVLDDFAPFSHDAQSSPAFYLPPPTPDVGVPEPGALPMLLVGAIAAAAMRRYRRHS